MSHTPTPWRVTPDAFRVYSADERGLFKRMVCVTAHNSAERNEESRSNALFIVQAANSHADLVAALERSLRLIETEREVLERSFLPEPSESEAELLTEYEETTNQAREALRRAKEGI